MILPGSAFVKTFNRSKVRGPDRLAQTVGARSFASKGCVAERRPPHE
jgi:hypothetical protein